MKLISVLLLSGALVAGGANLAAAQDQSGPAADANAAQNPAVKSPNDMGSGSLAKGHNSFTKGEARSRIEKAGYTDVRHLMLDSDGLWQATAQRNGQAVQVALDFKGNVAAQ